MDDMSTSMIDFAAWLGSCLTGHVDVFFSLKIQTLKNIIFACLSKKKKKKRNFRNTYFPIQRPDEHSYK